jgi:hypothetical protein
MIRMIKIKVDKIGQVCNMHGEINSYILAELFEGKRPIWGRSYRLEDNIKMDLIDIECKGVARI